MPQNALSEAYLLTLPHKGCEDMQPVDPTMYALLGLVLLFVPVTGVLMAVTPYLMPKRECFAVTIPDAASSDPDIKRFKRSFATIVAVVTLVLTALCGVSILIDPEHAFLVVLVISELVLCFGSYGFMLHFRQKTIALKQARGWKAQSAKRVGFVAEEPAPRPISQKWDLLFLVPIAITGLVCIVGYPLMPERIATNVNLSGQVSNWVEKTPLTAAFPFLTVVFLDACFVFSHWMILRSKKGVDAARPAVSAWAYGAFARVQSMLLVGLGTMLSFLGPIIALSFMGVITVLQAMLPILVMLVVVLVVVMAVTMIYGQNGARLLRRMEEPDSMPVDDDRYWKLGIFYWNRNDASLFVPERFGVGWTMNLGRPAAWVIIVGFVVVIAAFVVFSLCM